MDGVIFSMYVLKCFELGIIPIRNFDGKWVDVNKEIGSLSTEEARKMKRKFRKLWRKQQLKNQKTINNRISRSSYVHVALYKEAFKEFNKNS